MSYLRPYPKDLQPRAAHTSKEPFFLKPFNEWDHNICSLVISPRVLPLLLVQLRFLYSENKYRRTRVPYSTSIQHVEPSRYFRATEKIFGISKSSGHVEGNPHLSI